MSSVANKESAAPCGLYCGACIDYLTYRNCHGCGCECGKCAASKHHRECDIYKCCVENRRLGACCECPDFPCSLLIQFCYNPVWLHHLPVIENLRRRKRVGTEEWLKEQENVWKNKWYLQKWLWLQKECEERLRKSFEKQQ
ncbi:MAG: DUF3795 domain-containing protein [Candidatus Bathyarchaeia archaeon]